MTSEWSIEKYYCSKQLIEQQTVHYLKKIYEIIKYFQKT